MAEHEYASRGVANTGLGLSIGAVAAELLGGGLNGLFGGGHNCGGYNRYDADKDAQIAELKTEVKLRDANIYTDQKLADMNDRYERRFSCIEGQISQQMVYNATNTATLSCMQQQIATLQGLTKVVVPITSICPAPMPKYNSWVAPTTEAPAAGA